MFEKINKNIMKLIRKKHTELNDEQAEVVEFGLSLLLGEVPKIILLIIVSFLLGIGPLTLFAFAVMLPYRNASGGFHLKTHIGCFICTFMFYCGNVFLSKVIIIESFILKICIIILAYIFGLIMCKLYAPADTENVPIISVKERKKRRIMSYVFLTINLIAAIVISDNTISNILIFGTIIQTISISRFAYKLTNNKYGHEAYTVT